MSREKELAKNTVILSLGRFLPRLVAIVTLPIVTARLTKAEYGTYDLILTLIMLIMPIATLQIQSAAFRFLIDYRGDRENSARIITNIFAVSLPIAIVVSVVIGFFMTGLSVLLKIIISLYFIADLLYNTISQIARGLSFNGVYSVGSILLSVINGIGIVLSVQLMDKGLLGVVISLVIANFIAVLYIALKCKIIQYIDCKYISASTIKEMIGYSWPMIPNNLSSWVLRLSDRIIITAVLGVEANAVYAVANKIPGLLSVAQSVFVMAWHENASIAVKDKDARAYYSKMCDSIFSLLLGFTALLIGFTPIIFFILIRGDYSGAYNQIPILMLGMFFYCFSSFQGGIYIAHKKTANVGITTMVAAAINFIVDIVSVRFIGITAGSLSTLIAYVVLYVYRSIDVQRFQKIDYNLKKQAVLIALVIVMLVICFAQNFWLNIFNMAFAIVYFIVVNKDFIRGIWGKLKR